MRIMNELKQKDGLDPLFSEEGRANIIVERSLIIRIPTVDLTITMLPQTQHEVFIEGGRKKN